MRALPRFRGRPQTAARTTRYLLPAQPSVRSRETVRSMHSLSIHGLR